MKRFIRNIIQVRPEASFRFGNAGDLLNTYLLKNLFPYAELNPVLQWESPKLLCIGSVLRLAEEYDLIIGAGLLDPEQQNIIPKNINILGLRGPRTYDYLKAIDVDLNNVQFLLDPGVIAAQIYASQTKEKKGSKGNIIFIPHHTQRWSYQKLSLKVDFIDVDAKPDNFLRDIYTAVAVLTSSLHGLIIANTFGIPAVFFRPKESLFKYYDYAESVGLPLRVHSDPRSLTYMDIPTSGFEIKKSLIDAFQLDEKLLKSYRVAIE